MPAVPPIKGTPRQWPELDDWRRDPSSEAWLEEMDPAELDSAREEIDISTPRMNPPRFLHSMGTPKLARSISEASFEDEGDNWFILRIAVVLLVLIAFPCLCRFGGIGPPMRCLVLSIAVLLFNQAEVMPLYCTALAVPVLGTLYAVLGSGRSTTETSTLLASNVFNNTSFMVLGALVINGIFTKCGLEKRFLAWLLRNFQLDGKLFLLFLTLGGMFMCSVLYSGSLVLVAALAPALKDGVRYRLIDANASKRILIATAFCANAGSCLLPISSPVNLIAVSLLAEYDLAIRVDAWASIAIPVAILTMLGTWLLLFVLLPDAPGREARTTEEACQQQLRLLPREDQLVQLDDWNLLFLAVGLLAVLGITVFPTQLEPILGHPACVSIAVVVVVFGSGYMTREEFCQLDWDTLALVGGINVMAFAVRETGLGVLMSNSLEASGWIEPLPFQAIIAILVLLTVLISTYLGHSITGVLILPLVVAVGIKLHAARTVTIIVAAAVPFGMGAFNSSFDNAIVYEASRKLGRTRTNLRNEDFRRIGAVTTILAAFLFSTLGFHVSVYYFGHPGDLAQAAKTTPDKLKPKLIRENLRPNLPGPEDWSKLSLVSRMALTKSHLHSWGSHSPGSEGLRRGTVERWGAAGSFLQQVAKPRERHRRPPAHEHGPKAPVS